MVDDSEHPAIKHGKWIAVIAYVLTKNRPWLRLDTESEMKLQMVEDFAKNEDISENYLKNHARNKAKDWLRSRKASYSWKDKFSHISTQVTDDIGIQIDTFGNIYHPENRPRPPLLDRWKEPITDTRFTIYRYNDYIDPRPRQMQYDDLRVRELLDLCTDEEREILHNWFWIGLVERQEAELHDKSRSWASKKRTALINKLRKQYQEKA